MLTDKSKEILRSMGLLAEHIICLADCYDDKLENYVKTVFYNPEYAVKSNIVKDMYNTATEMRELFNEMKVEDLMWLYNEKNISVMELVDFIESAVRSEIYTNYKVRNAAKAFEEFILDMLYREIQDGEKYKNIAKSKNEKEII